MKTTILDSFSNAASEKQVAQTHSALPNLRSYFQQNNQEQNTQQQQVDELQKQSIQQKKLQPQENLSQ